MKKNIGLLLIIILEVVSFLFCDAEKEQQVRPIQFRELSGLPEDTTFQKGPYLMNTKSDRVTIMWETVVAGNSIVYYGETPEYGNQITDQNEVTLHEITIDGLDPETIYHYKVQTGDQSTIDLTFMTAIKNNSSFRFTVFGDTQDHPEISSSLVEQMISLNPFFVLHCGDIVGDGLVYEEWQEQFANPNRQLAHYIPYFMAIGNHERNSDWFYQFVSYPNTENNFSFTYGNAYFLVLDTNDGGLRLMMGEPLSWLQDQLDSTACQNATWRIAIHHQPAWTEGWGTSCNYDGESWIRELLVPLLEEADFDLVFNGHTHGYERGEKNGIHYIISGGGGGSLDVHCQEYDHITVAQYIHHFLQVDILGKTLELKAIDENDQVFDSLILVK